MCVLFGNDNHWSLIDWLSFLVLIFLDVFLPVLALPLIQPSESKIFLHLFALVTQPTKDRARKPRKDRDGQSATQTRQGTTNFTSQSVAVSYPRTSQSASLPFGSQEKPVLSPSSIVDRPRAKSPSITGSGATPLESTRPSPQPPSHVDDSLTESRRVTDRWMGDSLIGVKPVLPVNSVRNDAKTTAPKPISNGMVGRQALPGLASAGSDLAFRRPSQMGQVSNGTFGRPVPNSNEPPKQDFGLSGHESERGVSVNAQPLTPLASPSIPPRQEEKSPTAPARHSRIPSSGNRATVMDIAEALSSQSPPMSPGWREHRAEPSNDDTLQTADPTLPSVTANPTAINARSAALAAVQAEKRRSSYEKYSAIMLPPLKEERTPIPTPIGSLLRNATPPSLDHINGDNVYESSGDVFMQAITKEKVPAESDLVHLSKDLSKVCLP
jgi:hypothetical protein